MLVTRGTWKVKEVSLLKSLRSCRSPFLGNDDWEKGPWQLTGNDLRNAKIYRIPKLRHR